MKKFFSLMCAIAIVFSASAAPAKVLGKSKQAEVMEAKTVKAHKAIPATSLQKANFAAVAKRAPQAKHEDYNIDIVEYAESYFASDNDVLVKLYDADENVYYFDVVVAAGTKELAIDSTYTLADMIASFSYMRDSANNKVNYVSASLTKSIVMYEEQELVRFDAAFADTLGNNYTLVYEQAPFIITGDTIDVTFVGNANKPIYSEGLCQLRAQDDDNDIAFTFTCAEGAPAGTYAEEDMELDYTFVNDLDAVSAHCVVVENDGTILLEGWILASDGNVYHVIFAFTVPTIQSYDTIVATNLMLDDTYESWFGILIAYASNEDYAVEMLLDAYDYLGTFDAEDLDLAIYDAEENEIAIYDGSVTVANAADGVAISGSVLSMDGVLYYLNLTYVAPEATSEETLTLNGTITNYGTAWQFIGATDTLLVTIAAYADAIPGTYGRNDLMADYTYVVKIIGQDTLYYDMVAANVIVAVSDANATITGTLRGQNYFDNEDVIEFTLNLTASVEDYEQGGDEYDAQDADFTVDFAEYEIDEQYLAEYGVLFISAENENREYISLELWLPEGAQALAAGVYQVDAEEMVPGTVTACSVDQYIYGSFAGSFDAEGYINVPFWFINAGTVTVAEDGVIEVAATNTWGRAINSRLGAATGVENVEAGAAAVKRMVNGVLVIEKNGVQYNAQGAVVK